MTDFLALVELARGLIGQDYAAIRNSYIDALAAAMNGYLASEGAITRWRNDARRAIAEHFDAAFFTGYIDGGGIISEMPPEARAWFLARQQQEIGYVDQVFQDLKTVRAESKETGLQAYDIVLRRAEGYSKTLDGMYAEGKLRGNAEIMLTLQGIDGGESCPTCQRLKGQRHRAAWWVERGLVPKPGNIHYECGNWNCFHRLYTDEGALYAP